MTTQHDAGTSQDWIESRLDSLKRELEKGQAHMSELLEREARLRHTLLRIEGAILVLTELQQDKIAPA